VTSSARGPGAFAPGAALLAAGLLAVAAAPAGAAITATRDAPTVVRLAVDPARFMPSPQSPPSFYTGSGNIISLPPTGDPVGTGDAASALVPFPLDDTGFIVMSTGDATQADDPTGRARSRTRTTAALRSRSAVRTRRPAT
jgi:hypothetical protein